MPGTEYLRSTSLRMMQLSLDEQRDGRRDAGRAARAQIDEIGRVAREQSRESFQQNQAIIGEFSALREAHDHAADRQAAATDRLTETVERGLSDLGDRLGEGLEEINTTLSGIDATIAAGFAEVSDLLTQISTKLDWSEEYKRFLRFKKEAFALARHGDLPRAAKQGLAAISIRDAAGSAEDQIERDPTLCAFLARLLLAEKLPAFDGPKLEELAHRALDRGRMVGDEAGLQAAADAGRVLADCSRREGDWGRALDFEEVAQQCERTDVLSATARMLAARACTKPSAALFEAVAAHAIVYPKFLNAWTTQGFFVCFLPELDAAVIAVRSVLRERLAQASAARASHAECWSRLVASEASRSAVALAFGAGPGAVSEAAPLPLLAGRVREQYRRILQGDAAMRRFVSEQTDLRAAEGKRKTAGQMQAMKVAYDSNEAVEMSTLATRLKALYDQAPAVRPTTSSSPNTSAAQAVQLFGMGGLFFTLSSRCIGQENAAQGQTGLGLGVACFVVAGLIGAGMAASSAKEASDDASRGRINDAGNALNREHGAAFVARQTRYRDAVAKAEASLTTFHSRLKDAHALLAALPSPPVGVRREQILVGLDGGSMTRTDGRAVETLDGGLTHAWDVDPEAGPLIDRLIASWSLPPLDP